MSLTKSDSLCESDEQKSVLQKTSLESEVRLVNTTFVLRCDTTGSRINHKVRSPDVADGLPRLGRQLVSAGAAACLADLVTFPLDTAKVRLQVDGGGRGRGLTSTITNILRLEGPTALYSGLVPGLQRQMAFSAIRIGLYDEVKSCYTARLGVSESEQVLMLGVRVMAGVSTGALAILAAQPTDVVKIRLQAGGLGRYPGVWAAYTSIVATEGVGGLYRGFLPNIARNSIVNVGETVVYDAVKDCLLSGGHMKDGVGLHLASAILAGVSATLVASPVDVIKTRSRPDLYSFISCGGFGKIKNYSWIFVESFVLLLG